MLFFKYIQNSLVFFYSTFYKSSTSIFKPSELFCRLTRSYKLQSRTLKSLKFACNRTEQRLHNSSRQRMESMVNLNSNERRIRRHWFESLMFKTKISKLVKKSTNFVLILFKINIIFNHQYFIFSTRQVQNQLSFITTLLIH